MVIQGYPGSQRRVKANRAYVAAILNFFVWGLGYLYIGRRNSFSFLIVLGYVITLIPLFVPMGTASLSLDYQVVSGVGYLILDFAFAYDAYRLADVKQKGPNE